MATLGIGTLKTEVDQSGLKRGLGQSERESKGFFSRFGGVMKGALSTALGFGIFSIAQSGIRMVAGEIGDLVAKAPQIDAVGSTFRNLADSIGEPADAMLVGLRDASRGMVSDFDLMMGTNKFMAMGLVDTADQAARLTEISTQLASAMGVDATTGMADFAAMLANQSIPRLDNFGISSGAVRSRINELMAETQGMTRETAFMQAVMEQSAVTMGKIGEQGDSAAAAQSRFKAAIANTKAELGENLLPIIEAGQGILASLAESALPAVGDAMDGLAPIIDKVSGSLILFKSTGDVESALKAVVGSEAVEKLKTWLSQFDPIKKAIEKLQGTFEKSMPAIRDTVDDVISFFKDSFEGDGPGAIDTLKNALDGLARFWDQHGATVIGIVGFIFKTIIAVIDGAIGLLLGIINAGLALLSGDWEGAWTAIKDAALNIIESALALIGSDLDTFTATWSGALELLREIADKIWGRIKEAFMKPINAIRDGFNRVKGTIDNVRNAVQSFIDKVTSFKLPAWAEALLPGSPPPLAAGIREVRRELERMGGMMPRLGAQLDYAGASVGVQSSVRRSAEFNIQAYYRYQSERRLIDDINRFQALNRD